MTSREPISPTTKTSRPREAGVARHPRRRPANLSTSLLHFPWRQPLRSKLDSQSSSDSDNTRPPHHRVASGADLTSTLQPFVGTSNSGEGSSAEQWFEQANNEAGHNQASFADYDSPFFMQQSSSSETPSHDQQKQLKSPLDSNRANCLPPKTSLRQFRTESARTEDFRGVIDDLTVENKKLKRKLKRYKKFHDSPLKDEKLFEVRIHGLPSEKRRELAETLRKFTASLGPNGANALPSNGYSSQLPTLETPKAASSQTSPDKYDSTYASLSTSGQGSSEHSRTDGKQTSTPPRSLAARRRNIHSYLHHIPHGLLSRKNPATITDSAKKRLVIHRLEQIFVGNGAAVGGRHQLLQQQEVSPSDARASRVAVEAAGQSGCQEGTREAHIMDQEAEDPLNSRQSVEKQSPDKSSDITQLKDKMMISQSGAEQRPTRQSDLNPDRAQMPQDNIRYMRHLGFSPPDLESSESPEDGNGWIYLNFLINMAQLHTINVTLDFVQKALSDYRSGFEVSNDGSKVRWRGGNATSNRVSGGPTSNARTSDNTPDGRIFQQRVTSSPDEGTMSNVRQVSGASRRTQSERSKHFYTPLFIRRESTESSGTSSSEAEGAEDESVPSSCPAPVAGDTSGMTSVLRPDPGLLRGAPAKKQKQNRDDGPIIFYNNASFCTDLSGDWHWNRPNNSTPYTLASAIPVGQAPKHAGAQMEKRGPLASALELPEPMDISDNPIPEVMELFFPPQSPQNPDTFGENEPINLEVTGIGGVWPTDNFAISVETRHVDCSDEQAPELRAEKAPKSSAPRFARMLSGFAGRRKTRAAVRKQVLKTKVKNLPPSKLPPALRYMPVGEDSLDEEDSINDDDMSAALGSLSTLPSLAAPQLADISYTSFNEEDDEDAKDGEDGEDEIDFLVAARKFDPEAVREQEQRYRANLSA